MSRRSSTSVGGLLGVARFAVTLAGYRRLVAWMRGFGSAGTCRGGRDRLVRGRSGPLSVAAGIVVLEVTRPNRQERHRNGKDDDLDAINAARGVLAAGVANAVAKTDHGKHRGVARVGRCATLSEAGADQRDGPAAPPDVHRSRRAARSLREAVPQGPHAAMRPSATPPEADSVRYATKVAAVTLARRVQAARAMRSTSSTCSIAELVKQIRPGLLNVYGVGTDVAANVLVAVGDNPERIRTEAAFAKLCGVAPLPANSGKRTNRHRLNPGGNRHANSALWHVVLPASPNASLAPTPT